MLSVCIESISFKTSLAVLETGEAHLTTNIDLQIPFTTLHRTASEIKFDEKAAEVEAAVNSKGQSDIYEDQTDMEHGYDTDICQLVQAESAAVGVPARAYIQSMVVHEIIDYHANHLFPVVRRQVGAGINDAFTRGLLPKNIAIRRAQRLHR